MCANPTTERPRLSQTPLRIRSISAAGLSGNAATRLARPTRCSGSQGPSRRMNHPQKSAVRRRLVSRIARMTVSVSQPIPVSNIGANRRRRARARGCCGMPMASVAVSEADDDLAEHLPALQPRQPALDLAERELAVDHRQQAAGHLGEALADFAYRGAERADDAVLLLKELHQIE